MKKWISGVLALVFMAAFTLGCAGNVNKEAKVKCPKCGKAYSVDEVMKMVTP